MLDAIYSLDIDLYIWIRTLFYSPAMEAIAPVLSSPYGWAPWFAMLSGMLIAHRPGMIFRDLFFGTCAFILSYQFSHIISIVVQRESPISITRLLQADGEAILLDAGFYSFPDWAIAGFTGVIVFTWIRMGRRSWFLRILSWMPLLLLGLIRVYTQQCFPLDVFGGILTGLVVGILASRVAMGTDRFTFLGRFLEGS